LDLAAPDPVTRERVARHFLGAIENALADALGQRCPVRLGLAATPPPLPIRATSPSPDHTFDTFVVGDSNRDACAAAHTLLAARDPARLLVLTSDRVPGDMPALARCLLERVQGSVVAVIERPEPALRLAILHHKARARGVVLEPRLAVRVATAFGDSVRRLEGALNRLVGHARLRGRPIDEELAAEVLAELRPRSPS